MNLNCSLEEMRTRGGRVVIGRVSILSYDENEPIKWSEEPSNVRLFIITYEKSYETKVVEDK